MKLREASGGIQGVLDVWAGRFLLALPLRAWELKGRLTEVWSLECFTSFGSVVDSVVG